MFSVVFNEEDCLGLKIYPTNRPNIPAPEEKIEEVEVPGRDGVLTITENLYNTITIPVEFNFLAEPDEWGGLYRVAKRWLSGSGEMWFSDDPEVYYKVLYCKITDMERAVRRIGTFTCEFTCDPYTYYKSGKDEILAEDTIYNPGVRCMPIYRIEGEGLCTLAVNGNEFQANVGQEAVIDSNRMISYKTDGQSINTDVTGDYAGLWFESGDNTFSVTDGFTVYITPEWREL